MNESEEAPSISVLPEGCISDIVSMTSPRDASRVAAISKTFNTAADSDAVWEHFLPSDYREIIAKAVSPLVYNSKKQLYHLLSDSNILLDNGSLAALLKNAIWLSNFHLWQASAKHHSNQIEQDESSIIKLHFLAFKLDKESGKKCYMLRARDLGIEWQNDNRYWEWGHVPGSRFAEVAILKDVCWLNIWGQIGTMMLSRKSTYVAYLVFRISQYSRGLDVPARTKISIGGIRNETSNVYIQQRRAWEQRPAPAPCSTMRKDGWMEIELGEFYSDDGDIVGADMLFLEYESWKSGLTVEGIEFRPK